MANRSQYKAAIASALTDFLADSPLVHQWSSMTHSGLLGDRCGPRRPSAGRVYQIRQWDR